MEVQLWERRQNLRETLSRYWLSLLWAARPLPRLLKNQRTLPSRFKKLTSWIKSRRLRSGLVWSPESLWEKPPSLTSLLDASIAGRRSFPRMFPPPLNTSGILTSRNPPKLPWTSSTPPRVPGATRRYGLESGEWKSSARREMSWPRLTLQSKPSLHPLHLLHLDRL